MEDSSKTVKLKKPLKFGDKEITEIVFREPVAKDLRKLSGSPGVGELLDLAAGLSDLPTPQLINGLKLYDTNKVLEAITAFFEDGPETGSED